MRMPWFTGHYTTGPGLQATNNDISKLLKSRKFNRGGTTILAYLENSCDDSRNMTQRNLSEKIHFDVES